MSTSTAHQPKSSMRALGPAAEVLRGLTAACVLLSADVHLQLWADGMRDVHIVGPSFLLNAVGGLVIGLAVLVWAHPLPLVAAVGFGFATLAGFVVSATVGLFGVHETWTGVPQTLAAGSEVGAILCAGAALALERRRRS